MKDRSARLTQTGVVAAIALLCCLLWSSAASIIKTGYRLMGVASTDSASQILFAGSRFFLAGILSLTIGSIVERRLMLPVPGGWGRVAKLSLVMTVAQYVSFYLALAHSSGVRAAIYGGAGNMLCILVACFLFRSERMNAIKVIGCVLGFGGILIINLSGNSGVGGFTLIGDLGLFISVFSNAVAASMSHSYSQKEDPLALTAWQFLLGGGLMIAVGLALGGRLNFTGILSVGSLVYLGFVSACAYSLWNLLLKYNPVSRISIFGFMTPIFGVLLSAVILGETQQALSASTLTALALVSAGILTVNLLEARKKKRLGEAADKSKAA